MAVSISVTNKTLVMNVEGIDKLLSFKGSMQIPLEHVKSVRRDPDALQNLTGGVKVAGAGIPGLIRAGTWAGREGLAFWDVRHADRTLVIELHDERYARLIVEVDDPDAAVSLIEKALSGNPGT